MTRLSGDGWYGDVQGMAPVQGCGRVDGHAWYFRARGAAWSMEIADDRAIDPDALPLVGTACAGWLVEEAWGAAFEAGYMPVDTVQALVERCIAQFRQAGLPWVERAPRGA